MEEKIQRLSEGYDFIEESTAFSDSALSYEDSEDLVISESNSGKSPYKILGRACGCFAPIGEFSRNKRLYSDDLWPTVLANEEFNNRLQSRSIFGCISHSDKKVDDVDIREGKVSHIVSKLEIHEDANGKPFLYGELEILDTPAGRILEAMYKGGANLYVSSRGAGKLIPVPGKDYAMVKPDSYFVECFDVVCRPGFLKAKPVYEGVSEDNKEVVHESLEDEKHKKDAEDKEYAKLDKARRDSAQVRTCESSEIITLKSQIDKLAKIVEKVVDDVYETQEEPKEKVMAEKPKEAPQMQEQPIAPVKKEKTNEALADFVNLMASTNISEDKFSEILDIIAASKKENK